MERLNLAARCFSVALAAMACTVVRAGPWVALPLQSPEIKAGSALDFSGLSGMDAKGEPIPAGQFGPVLINKEGKFVFANRPANPVRFFAASFAVSPASGSFPEVASAGRMAVQLRRAGYNLVRFHMVDAVLMNQTRANLVFDRVQLDRLHALLAALKKEGIYWIFDGLSSAMGGYSNSVIDKYKGQWDASPYNVKSGVYVSDMYRDHYKALAKILLTTVNPYTGLSTIDDPALAGIVMVNEGGIDFAVFTMGSKAVRDALVVPFNRWLRAKYVTNAALQAAWSDASREIFDPANESLADQNIRFPANIFFPTARNIDAQKFFIDEETATAAWMTAFFRTAKAQGGLGYKGPLTSLNNWSTLQANLSRSQFSWVDMHVYFDDPTHFADRGSTNRQISSLYDPDPKLGPDGAAQRSLGYVHAMAANRHAGQPFSVSEYSHVFWNAWRREGMAFAAYASLQDWDMICQFNEPVVLERIGVPTPARHQAIYPYQIGLDPIAKVTETLAALLFLRGDVSPSSNAVVFKLGANNFQPPNSSMGNAGGLRYSVAALSLLTRIGVVADGPATTASAAMLPKNWRGSVAPIALTGTESIEQLLDLLSAAGTIPKDRRTDLVASIYESDTRQLVLRGRERSLSIATPRTEAMSFDRHPPTGLRHLAIEKFDVPAVVALSSVDGNDLDRSDRMLLTISTDAINSGMTFLVAGEQGTRAIKRGELTDYTERTVLHDLGHLPVLLESTKITLTIRNPHARQLAVYALALNGERTATLSTARATADGAIVVVIDTEKTPTTYFEVATSAYQ